MFEGFTSEKSEYESYERKNQEKLSIGQFYFPSATQNHGIGTTKYAVIKNSVAGGSNV